MLGAGCYVLGARCSVLGARCSKISRAPNIESDHRAPSPSTYLDLSRRHLLEAKRPLHPRQRPDLIPYFFVGDIVGLDDHEGIAAALLSR